MRKYVYTADDEFPDCMQCDNVNQGCVMVNGVKKDYCSEYCGAEKAWSRYTRTEYVFEHDNYNRDKNNNSERFMPRILQF